MVREIISEQDVVADDPLIKVFVEPFTDVIKTANAEIQKNLTTARVNIKSLIKQAAILAIPFLAAEMIKDTQEQAQNELKAKLAKIDEKYAEVYKRNWDAVRNRDVWGITFLLNPMMGVTSKFAMKAPLATLNLLETLTAGGLSEKNEERLRKAKEFATKLAKPVSPNYGGGGGGSFGFSGAGDFGDYGGFGGFGEANNPITEQQAQTQNPMMKLAAFVEKFKQLPEVQQAVKANQTVDQFRQAAFDAVLKAAAPVLQAKSYQDLAAAIGTEFNKFEKQVFDKIDDQLSKEEEEQVKQNMVPSIKNAYKQVLITQLSKQKTGDKQTDKALQSLILQIKKM